MGINLFCKFLDVVQTPSTSPDPFDSILIDGQSFLYVAIDQSLEIDEDKCFQEICHSTWFHLHKTLDVLLAFPQAQTKITIVISFDGEGVPMKWPTQQKRRSQSRTLDRKSLYRYALFGYNILSKRMESFLIHKLRHYASFPNSIHELKIILSGCNVPGEGEHKIFHVAHTMPEACRKPIIVSIDQDVFVIALLRLNQFESMQIYRYEKFYPVSQIYHEKIPYSPAKLIVCSFLFGNDFIQPLVSISEHNKAIIHHSIADDDLASLSSSDDDEEDISETHPAYILSRFLKNMKSHLRYENVSVVNRELIISFWITYLWLNDYYRLRYFDQKYLLNPVYSQFDRNQILTALEKCHYSFQAYEEAQKRYLNVKTEPYQKHQAERAVFTDESVLQRLKSYFLEQHDESCVLITVKRKNIK